jgi:hypothetical protein
MIREYPKHEQNALDAKEFEQVMIQNDLMYLIDLRKRVMDILK